MCSTMTIELVSKVLADARHATTRDGNDTSLVLVVVVGYENKLRGLSGIGICVFYYQFADRRKFNE